MLIAQTADGSAVYTVSVLLTDLSFSGGPIMNKEYVGVGHQENEESAYPLLRFMHAIK